MLDVTVLGQTVQQKELCAIWQQGVRVTAVCQEILMHLFLATKIP